MIAVNWATEPDFIIGLMKAIVDQDRFVYLYGNSFRQLSAWGHIFAEEGIPFQRIVGLVHTRRLLGVKDTYLFALTNVDVRPLIVETTQRNIEIVKVRNA